MAQEILLIDKDRCIFFKRYAAPPIIIGGEPQVLTFASSDLPPLAAAFFADTLPAAFAAIDNGLFAWKIEHIERAEGETLAHLQQRYFDKWRRWDAEQEARIAKWAAEIDAVRWVNVPPEE